MGDSEPQNPSNYRLWKQLEFFRSETFIAIAVVLALVIVAVWVFCCVRRRRHTRRLLTERMTEIVVDRSGSDSQNVRPKYSFRIKTDQDHATKLVQIMTSRPDSVQSAQRPSLSRLDLEEPGPSGNVPSRQRRAAALDTAGLRKWPPKNIRHEERLNDESVSAPLILVTTEVPPLLSSQQMVTLNSLNASQSAPAILLNPANRHTPSL